MRRDDKILVVENNAEFCRTIEERFNCDCATDGWDAISKLQTEDYAAVVIDADVPHHSGYGVLAYLREEVGEDLRNVIFMTASSDQAAVRRNFGNHLTVVNRDQAVEEITRVLEG